MADARALARACPRRVTGSAGAGCAVRFIEKRFRELGLPVRIQSFRVWLHGRPVTGRNVFALSRGTSTRAMLLLAHYDTPVSSREAPAVETSGVAVLLELARIFSTQTRDRSILFLATDAQTWGMIGADRFATGESWKALLGPHATPPYGALSLDSVKSGVARGIAMEGSGQFQGYTPLWLRRLVAVSIREAGIRVEPEKLPRQILARALAISWQDQGPLLRRGIPAINISTLETGPSRARRVYHRDDALTADLLPGAMGLYGRAAESATLSLNGAGVLDSEDALSVTPHKVLSAAMARWMALALFLPLFALTASTIARPPAGLWRAVLRVTLLALPVFAPLLVLRLSALANLLPRYELYPPGSGDPFLGTWQPLPLLLSLGVAVIAAGAARRGPRTGAAALRAAALLALCGVALWAWARNDLAAAIFLAPAAWLCPWIGALRGGSGRRRAFDAALALASAAPFLLLLAGFARILCLGPRILWYVPLQVAYGVFTLHAAAITGVAAGAVVALLLSAAPRPAGGAPSLRA